ncbi:hypothetical protein TEGAF0_25000 [Sediminibacterium sp. TEGAF015]|nr:hypothetical protein TEGAF0_25000 [Sediminibacterium sp. TEGAF015]
MEQFYHDTLNKLETAINELEIDVDSPIQHLFFGVLALAIVFLREVQ